MQTVLGTVKGETPEGCFPQFSRLGTFAPIVDANGSKGWPFPFRSLTHLQGTAQLLKYSPVHLSKPKVGRLLPHRSLNVVITLVTSSLVAFEE